MICGASSEHSELDTLDGPAVACYAISLPAGLRSKELGEGFASRLASSAAPAVGKAAPAKPAAKGAPAAVVAKAGAWNELVKDPDQLTPCAAPTDPLVVGAFSILQRVGTVLPGETSGFDVTFDPSGCATAHERFRIFISGVDYTDGSTQSLKDFDVSGDSCIPAIIDDDMNGIFEEQEVVASLAEASSASTGE